MSLNQRKACSSGQASHASFEFYVSALSDIVVFRRNPGAVRLCIKIFIVDRSLAGSSFFQELE